MFNFFHSVLSAVGMFIISVGLFFTGSSGVSNKVVNLSVVSTSTQQIEVVATSSQKSEIGVDSSVKTPPQPISNTISVPPPVVPKETLVNYLPAYLGFLNSQKDFFTKQRSILDPLISDAQSKSNSYDIQASYFSGLTGQGLAEQIYQSFSKLSNDTSQLYIGSIASLKARQSLDDDVINTINTEENNDSGLFLSSDEYTTKYNSSKTYLSNQYNLIMGEISEAGNAYFAQDKGARDNEAQLLGQLQSLTTAPSPVYLQPPTPKITICNFSGNAFICN